MATVSVLRKFYLPSVKATRRIISLLVALAVVAPPQGSTKVVVRYLTLPKANKKKILLMGLLKAGAINRNVILYRKPNGFPAQYYPKNVWRRPTYKALGQKVAPVIPVGGGGTGVTLTHALGLSLMSLGGVKY